MIYEGSPSRTMSVLVAALRRNLDANKRCLVLNSPAMIAGFRSHLYASGTDVEVEVARGALALTANLDHLVNGTFDISRMIDMLDAAAQQALADGFAGLFATGDMTWEFGPERELFKLVEYEWRLEQLFHKHPSLSGVCQYHRDLLPPEAMRVGLVSHGTLFVSDTISQLNPHFVQERSLAERQAAASPHLDDALAALFARES